MNSGEKITLRYKVIWVILSILVGLLGLAIAVKNIFFDESLSVFSLISSVLYVALSIIVSIFQYGKIENGHIRRMDSFKKGIDLDKITHARKVSKTYVIESGDREVVFNTRIMRKESQQKLEEVLTEKGYNFEE